jgi:hypothetical protein
VTPLQVIEPVVDEQVSPAGTVHEMETPLSPEAVHALAQVIPPGFAGTHLVVTPLQMTSVLVAEQEVVHPDSEIGGAPQTPLQSELQLTTACLASPSSGDSSSAEPPGAAHAPERASAPTRRPRMPMQVMFFMLVEPRRVVAVGRGG